MRGRSFGLFIWHTGCLLFSFSFHLASSLLPFPLSSTASPHRPLSSSNRHQFIQFPYLTATCLHFVLPLPFPPSHGIQSILTILCNNKSLCRSILICAILANILMHTDKPKRMACSSFSWNLSQTETPVSRPMQWLWTRLTAQRIF